MKQAILLVIDDEADLAELICDVAKQENFKTYALYSGRSLQSEFTPDADLIFLDLMMPDMDGIEVIRFLAQKKCTAQLVLMSGFDEGVLHSAEQLAIAQGLNLVGTLKKPFRFKELKAFFKSLDIVPQNKKLNTHKKNIALSELQEAIIKDELIVYFQPKVSLKNDSALTVEALVRWQHPQLGLLGPDRFIPMAEEHNLIDDLTWDVMSKVMQQCALWNTMDLKVTVAVNMSAKTLKDLKVPELIDGMLQKYKLEASQIILEVTETALMQELTKSLDILTRLRLKGIRLSIDDFGTGYSSLVQLHKAPFSEIKIDQSFIFKLLQDKESLAIAEMVITLGHKLRMQVVAEGVESQEILDKLQEMGCDIIQGYHISRPQPADIITPWLVEYKKSLKGGE